MTFKPEPDPMGQPSDGACPYVGLVAFHESDAARFHGRDTEISALLVRREEHGDRPLVIIGPSGCGKSSLIAAGLIPQLRKNAADQGEELRTHSMVPTRFPLEALAVALGSRQSQTDAESFALSTEQAVHLGRVETGPTLLVVDQFEELFSLCARVDRQQAFAAALVALAADAEARTTVVIALRSEAEDRLVALPELQELVRSNAMRVPPLSAVNLRRAIERPAHAVRVGFEEGVVERLVDEVEGEVAALPLLQFTLLALWQRRRDSLITMAAMDEIGGARRALEKSAEAVYLALIPEEANCARRVFGRLVRCAESGEFVRRRALRSELRSLEDPSRVDRVMQPFVAARLLVQRPIERDAVLEITHESLLRSWPRFAAWLEDSRHLLRQHAQLQEAMTRWRAGNGDVADLLSPGRIAAFSELTELDGEEKRFLKQSSEHWQWMAQRSLGRRRLTFAALGIVAAVAAGGWWFAWQANQGARDLAAQAKQQALLAHQQRDLTQAASGRESAQRKVADGQRTLAANARKEADLRTAKAVELQQKLEVARDQLRKDLSTSRGREVDTAEGLVRLLERALPDLGTLARPAPDDTRDASDFDGARRGLVEVGKLAAYVRSRVSLLDAVVNSKERQRDKESLKSMRALHLRVSNMKQRLQYFDAQLQIRRKQLELAQRRDHQWATLTPATRARATTLSAVRISLQAEKQRLQALAGKRTVAADAAVWEAAKKLSAARKPANERALVMNTVGLAWYGSGRFAEAQKSFAAASRAAVSNVRRDRYVINRAWAAYREAVGREGVERDKLLLRADGLIRDAERRDPRASALRDRLHVLSYALETP